jgi:hypothetical protein
MELRDLAAQVPDFDGAAPKDRIQLLAWWLHTHQAKELFGPADIRACFDTLHMSQQAIATYLARMTDKGELLMEKGQYKLARSVRTDLDKKYGVDQSVVAVSKLLADLPARVPNLAQKTFLDEALKCYRVQAFRACIVMTWNLAYDHVQNWLLADPARLSRFNAAIAKRNSKKAALVVTQYDDFEDLKEREVIDICNIANLINSSVYKILVAKLDRRNMAAHPSSIIVVQAQADDVVTDLVNNVVLSLV